MVVGVGGAVAALLAAIRVAGLPAADLGTAERTVLPTHTLPVQSAGGAAHLWDHTHTDMDVTSTSYSIIALTHTFI